MSSCVCMYSPTSVPLRVPCALTVPRRLRVFRMAARLLTARVSPSSCMYNAHVHCMYVRMHVSVFLSYMHAYYTIKYLSSNPPMPLYVSSCHTSLTVSVPYFFPFCLSNVILNEPCSPFLLFQ